MNMLPWINGGTPTLASEPRMSSSPWWALAMLPDSELTGLFPEAPRTCVVCGDELVGRALRYCAICKSLPASRRFAERGDDELEVRAA